MSVQYLGDKRTLRFRVEGIGKILLISLILLYFVPFKLITEYDLNLQTNLSDLIFLFRMS